MNDYRITVKVRNSRLLTAIEKSGNKLGHKFSELVGVRYQTLLDYVNCKRVPFDENLNLRPCAEKICIYFNKLPNDLWSEKQLIPLHLNTVSMEVSSLDIDSYLLTSSVQITDPIELVDHNETVGLINGLLENLTPREIEVLGLRYGFIEDEKTLKSIGEIINVTTERVRQIEARAIRKLRNPKLWTNRDVCPHFDTSMSYKEKLYSLQLKANSGKGVFCVRLIHQRLVNGDIAEAKGLVKKHWEVLKQYPDICEHLYVSHLLDEWIEDSIKLRKETTQYGNVYVYCVVENYIYGEVYRMLQNSFMSICGGEIYKAADVITAAIGICGNKMANDIFLCLLKNMSLSNERIVEVNSSVKAIRDSASAKLKEMFNK